MDNSPVDRPSNKASSRRFLPQRRFWTSSALIFITASGCVALFIFWQYRAHLKDALGPEIFNSTYSFLLTAIIGGTLSFLYKEFADERNRDQARLVLLRTMHSDLLDGFNASKLARRTLRARIGYSPVREAMQQRKVYAVDYREQMEIVIKSQLKFEAYSKKANEQKLFFAKGEDIKEACGTIEQYLSKIIKEYEMELTNFNGEPPSKQLVDLLKLAEFISPFEEGKEFDVNFKRPFKAALKALSSAGLT